MRGIVPVKRLGLSLAKLNSSKLRWVEDKTFDSFSV